MESLTRRNVLATSATAIAASCITPRNAFAGDAPDVEWVPVQVHLQYQQSQTEQLKPVMERRSQYLYAARSNAERRHQASGCWTRDGVYRTS